jgi:AcrR family transcriptional regulator
MPDEGAAIREIRAIIKAALEIFAEKGVPMPAPDSGEVEVVEDVLPLLNLSEVARVAGLNRATLASRARRAKRKFVPKSSVAQRLARRLAV